MCFSTMHTYQPLSSLTGTASRIHDRSRRQHKATISIYLQQTLDPPYNHVKLLRENSICVSLKGIDICVGSVAQHVSRISVNAHSSMWNLLHRINVLVVNEQLAVIIPFCCSTTCAPIMFRLINKPVGRRAVVEGPHFNYTLWYMLEIYNDRSIAGPTIIYSPGTIWVEINDNVTAWSITRLQIDYQLTPGPNWWAQQSVALFSCLLQMSPG